jgi:hypothetical protein
MDMNEQKIIYVVVDTIKDKVVYLKDVTDGVVYTVDLAAFIVGGVINAVGVQKITYDKIQH